MLEVQHALVVKGLQQLYTHCIKNKCFPGEPIDVVDGNPLTHAILDRLGLIKQAENEAKNPDSATVGISPFWEERRGSSSSADTNDPSPEPNAGSESSQSSVGTSNSDKDEFGAPKYGSPPAASHASYNPYPGGEHMWNLNARPTTVASIESREAITVTAYYGRPSSGGVCASGTSNMTGDQPTGHHILERESTVTVGNCFSQAETHDTYQSHLSYQPLNSSFGTVGQPYSWN
jgi:hypothetical protein